MKVYTKFVCVLLFGLLLISSVFAESPNSGTISDSTTMIETYSDPGTTTMSDLFISSIYFTNIEYVSELYQLTYQYDDYYSLSADCSATSNKPCIYNAPTSGGVKYNHSQEYVTFRDLITNTIVGDGYLSYYVSNSNDLTISLNVISWYPTGLTGSRVINLSNYYQSSTAVPMQYGGTWHNNTLPWYIKYTGNPPTVSPTYSDPVDNIFFSRYSGTNVNMRATTSRKVTAGLGTTVAYERIPLFPLDTFNIVRGELNSNIALKALVNSTWNEYINETGIYNIFGVTIPNGSATVLTMYNPATGNRFTRSWDGFYPNLTSEISFEYFDGNSYSNYLDEYENTDISFSTEDSIDNIGKVIWEYTDTGNYITPTQKVFIRNGTLFYEGGTTGTGYTWDDVNTLTTHFHCSDFNSSASCNLRKTFNNVGRNYVKVTLYNGDLSHSMMGTANVYVGATSEKPIIIMNVRDVANNALLNIGGTFHVYDNTTATDNTFTPSPTSSMELTYGHIYTYWYVPSMYNVSHYSFSNDGQSPISTHYDFAYITAYWTNTKYISAYLSKAPPGYYTITFRVMDQDNNPFEDVKVEMSGGDTKYTDSYGLVSYQLPKDTNYEFGFSYEGYEEYSYTTYLDKNMAVDIFLNIEAEITPTPTTVTPTPTTTAETDILAPMWDLLGNYGITFAMFKLILAGVIMAVFAGLLGNYAPGPQSPLVGAGIGFVIDIGLGLLDIWIAIVAIVIFGIIYARKLTNDGG